MVTVWKPRCCSFSSVFIAVPVTHFRRKQNPLKEGFTLSPVNFRSAIYTTIFVVAITMVITLLVWWSVYIINDYRTIKGLHIAMYGHGPVPTTGRWIVLILGIAFLGIVIAILSVFFAHVMRGNRFRIQQRDFTNMVTHELRLPLSSIQVFTQTLQQREVEPETQNKFLAGILTECSRLGLLIDQLLKLQQIDQRKLFVQRRPLDAADFLKSFTERWPRPLNVQASESIPVEADPMLLELALLNLVTNAEKYGRGSIPEITLSRLNDQACFSVRDRGRPIPKQYLRRIFRKFYRIPNSNTRRQNGVGLGLYIVKNIAKLHGGDAQVIPLEPPMGNEFSIRIPASNRVAK